MKKMIGRPEVSSKCPEIVVWSFRLSVSLKNFDGRMLKVDW